jgi:hypothetical protein
VQPLRSSARLTPSARASNDPRSLLCPLRGVKMLGVRHRLDSLFTGPQGSVELVVAKRTVAIEVCLPDLRGDPRGDRDAESLIDKGHDLVARLLLGLKGVL